MKRRKDAHSINLYQDSSKKLIEIYSEQEVFQRQRCKQLCLWKGDSNIKFFHAATKTRRKLNKIKTFINDYGKLVGWGSGLDETMVGQFSSLFSATDTDCSEVINCVTGLVIENQNSALLAEVHPREVKAALFNKNPDKSPGPDGMSPGFYKKYWKVVGTYLVQRTQQLFTTDKFDQSITDTNIVWFPRSKTHHI